MHARAIHSGLQSSIFTPFRDIWIPLDLSNAASFYGILAHAAADLANSRVDDNGSNMLKYKAEAVGIINKWLGTAVTALKDEVFTGVVRLLTFEVRDKSQQNEYRVHSTVPKMLLCSDHASMKLPRD